MSLCFASEKQKREMFEECIAAMKTLGFTDREAYISTKASFNPRDRGFITLAKEFGVTPEEMRAEWQDVGRTADKLEEERDARSP